MRPHLQRSTKSIPRFYNQLFHWTFLDRISCINFIISLAILDTSYLNMHFFGTRTCLCRLQNCPSADFWQKTEDKRSETRLKTECEARAYYSYATLTELLYWFWEKSRWFCSLAYWISMRLRDQIRSDPGRICFRITAWDQALWWGTGEFVIVLDSCCIRIGLVFIKDRPVSSFGCFVFEIWVLRFRVLGASCFGLRFRVLRFRNYPIR